MSKVNRAFLLWFQEFLLLTPLPLHKISTAPDSVALLLRPLGLCTHEVSVLGDLPVSSMFHVPASCDPGPVYTA